MRLLLRLLPLWRLLLYFFPSPIKDLFTKFMKVFMETTKAQTLVEPRDCPLKVKIQNIYFGKSNMDCYYFCQQYKDYFEISGATGINCTLFATIFLWGTVSLRWAQHKILGKLQKFDRVFFKQSGWLIGYTTFRIVKWSTYKIILGWTW